MKTRILYVTDSLIAGGIESQLVELLLRLDSSRFQPQVLCLYGERSGRAPHFAGRLRDAGIPFEVLDIGWGVKDKFWAAGRIARTARSLRPHLIQLEGYHANLLSRPLRPILGSSRIFGTVRGIETAKQLRYQRLGQWACSRIVVSGLQLKQMIVEQAGVPVSKVVVIPNAVDVRRFASSPEAAVTLRRELAPGGERLLLSVGRISRQKRMHLIPEALGLLKSEGRLPPSLRVCILGQVEDAALQARLEGAIHAGGLEDVVMQRPETALPEVYYHASDATILYTTLEGISIAMLESLASGRPVLISEEANTAGIIEDGRTGWVVPTDDLPAFASTLSHVASLPEPELRTMREACLRRSQDFSIETLVQRYSELYDSLAS